MWLSLQIGATQKLKRFFCKLRGPPKYAGNSYILNLKIHNGGFESHPAPIKSVVWEREREKMGIVACGGGKEGETCWGSSEKKRRGCFGEREKGKEGGIVLGRRKKGRGEKGREIA